MAIWKKVKNIWMQSWQEKFMDFSRELDSAACINSNMSKSDVDKCRKLMNTLRLMFNRYA